MVMVSLIHLDRSISRELVIGILLNLQRILYILDRFSLILEGIQFILLLTTLILVLLLSILVLVGLVLERILVV